MVSDWIEIVTTFENRADAKRIAAALIERSLAACVQIGGPIESWYRWKGKTEQSEEWTCFIKTHRDNFGRVEACLTELHPYEVPQIITLEIERTSAAYGAWLREQIERDSSASS